MIQEHSRFEIWNQSQHPYKHTLADFGYANPAVPGATNLETAMNTIFAVLYPQTKPAVPTVPDLPAAGNTINDYRVVQDDGDGKAASYRWEQREGDVAPQWYKIYDMDWGADSILTAYLDVTQDLYVWKRGRTDISANGNPITGLYGGQRISGGNQTNQNLTLDANSVDGTGYVQTTNSLRPTVDDAYDLGTISLGWANLFLTQSAQVSSLLLSAGSITDASGLISFFDNDLVTTGALNAGVITGTSFVVGSLTISDGSIEDTDGTISFGATSLSTTGTLTAASGSSIGTLTLADGSITDTSGDISFGNNDLTTTGNVFGTNGVFTQVDAGNTRLAGNTLSITNTNGNLILEANGTGIIDIQSAFTSGAFTTTGAAVINGDLSVDALKFDGASIITTTINTSLSLTPDGTGDIIAGKRIVPATNGLLALGSETQRFSSLFIATSIGDGTTEISSGTLQSLRDINAGVAPGMSIFWTGTKWEASLPDTEIDHGSLTGLGDDDHAQYMLLAGRNGGQALIGGQASAEDLVLESTADATKGKVRTKDSLTPFTNAAYSGTWAGADLGDATHYFRDIYTKGEAKGFRLENFVSSGLPASSAQNVGRLVYTTDTKKVYVDTGTALQVAGVAKFVSDVAFDGVAQTVDVTITGITDARLAQWTLTDNANDFDRIYCSIKATSASNVRVTTWGALPAGNYRLIGLE
jgi:hypothetical protein